MTHLQGPVPIDDPSYVQRPFEHAVQRELMKDQWVLLLGPRQHGKTSALVRIKRALIEAGLEAAFVDLQAAPPFNAYEELVGWFCGIIRDQFAGCAEGGGATDDGSKGLLNKIFGKSSANEEGGVANDAGNEADLVAMLESVLPNGNAPVAILIDEASNISEPAWRNSFFGQLRSISSRRADAESGDIAARLRFVFAGTFRYETLIDEKNSPFNVCEHIYTEDLPEADVLTLTSKVLGAEHTGIGAQLYAEVGGQPFLVQRLLGGLEDIDDPEEAVPDRINSLRTDMSSHLEHLFGKILAESDLSEIVMQMVRDGAAPNEAADPNHRFLQVLGIAQRDGTDLKFRNALYQYVASASPQLGGGASSALLAPMFPLPIGSFDKVQDQQLREIAWSAHSGAVAAYRAQSNRLALAGFGSSLEAILIDLLLRQPAGTHATIAQQAGCDFNGSQKPDQPKTWSLFNLIKAAAKVGGTNAIEPPQVLRKWRNTVHPVLAQANYRPDCELEPEARTAASLHEIVLRDLQ